MDKKQTRSYIMSSQPLASTCEAHKGKPWPWMASPDTLWNETHFGKQKEMPARWEIGFFWRSMSQREREHHLQGHYNGT